LNSELADLLTMFVKGVKNQSKNRINPDFQQHRVPLVFEPAETSAFPAACLFERIVNPVYGTAGLASESKIGKIPYREDSLQACHSEADLSAYAVWWRSRFGGTAGWSSIAIRV
jgi:hypothetical protein